MKSIVIWAVGCIDAALRLKVRKHDVTIIEKHNDLDGRARVFKKMVSLLIMLNFLSNSYELNDSILKVIFIGLASLTFPHILLEYLLEKNEK